MRLFPITSVSRRRIVAFAKQVDRYCAQINGGLFAVALALAFLAASMFILQNLTLPDPVYNQFTPAISDKSTAQATV